MKNFLFYSLTFLLLMGCGQKSNEKESNDDETEVAIDDTQMKADSIAQAEADAFNNPDFLPFVIINPQENSKLYLRANGVLAFNDKNLTSGKYSKDNGAYLMFWGEGDVPHVLSVIVGDMYYPIYDSLQSDNDNFQYVNDYFMSNFFVEENPFKDVVSYDKEKNAINYKTENGEKNLSLSEIPEGERRKVMWSQN